MKKIQMVDLKSQYEKIKDEIESKFVGDALEDMMSALMDDLNTPQVIAVLKQSKHY